VEVRVPALPPRTGSAFEEISRRHGDFALTGAAAILSLDAAGRIERARLVFTAVGPTPVRPRAAEAALEGQVPGDDLFRTAGEMASADLEPEGDLHASAAYRKEVSGVMARRALARAAARAASPAA
jgi:carbon-monoxide dehydrogenase medium subunit